MGDPKAFREPEAKSAVLPLGVSERPRPAQHAFPLEPLTTVSLGAPVDARIDDMLKRLHEHDYLGALTLAESIFVDVPGHGLATICRTECATVLAATLEGTGGRDVETLRALHDRARAGEITIDVATRGA